ncbi:Vta1 like-domain-containing protein [Pelagophyceae sp. CCMP2097]|nr:Vta1 like-domain-containing protein [Pelagophyceae sp. CCMP2097]
MAVPVEFKAVSAFLKRAEELDKDSSRGECRVVAFYCRQHAMEMAIGLRSKCADAKAANAFLGDLMDALETEKQALGDISRDEGEQVLFKFATDVFARADEEDRAGRATRNTAKTFYAASVFLDALRQFGDRGEQVDEKTRYAKWKATEILKAFKEGRTPTPGGPNDADDAQLDAQLPLEAQLPDAAQLPPATPAFEAPPPPAALPPPAEDFAREYQGPPTSPVTPAPPPPYEDSFAGPAAFSSAPALYAPPPLQHYAPAAPPAPSPPASIRVAAPAPAPAYHPPAARAALTKDNYADALEYCRFAIAAINVKEREVALDRLRGAMRSLGE